MILLTLAILIILVDVALHVLFHPIKTVKFILNALCIIFILLLIL